VLSNVNCDKVFASTFRAVSLRHLTCLPVKKAGLAIADPTELAGGNYKAVHSGLWWVPNLGSARKGRSKIGDAPINHGGREDGNLKSKFINQHRQTRDDFRETTSRLEPIPQKRTANASMAICPPLHRTIWDGTLRRRVP
jgi:hypothetical protein